MSSDAKDLSNVQGRADRDGLAAHTLVGVAAVIVLVFGFGGWAATAELSGALIAQGTVVVESNVKKVQHPTGGIVEKIYVDEGDAVAAGDVLVRLDETLPRANLQIITGQLDELAVRSVRLEAELNEQSSLILPADLVARAQEPALEKIISGEMVVLSSRREAHRGKKAQIKERIIQLGEEIKGLGAQQVAKEREIKLISDELVGLIQLREKDLVPSIKVMSLERDKARLEGEHGQLMSASAQARGRIAEFELQIVQLDQDLKAEITKELREIQAKEAELAERRIAAEDQLKRIEIRSPQAGFVHQLSVHTVGGVVSPTEPLMLIVPKGDKLVVDAKFSPKDIDNLEAGQKALIRFSGMNTRTTAEVEGVVMRVSADLTADPHLNQSYYVARIALPITVTEEIKGLKLVPGMPAEVHVRTGARTMAAYLMKPLADQYARAFTEQ